MGRIIALLQVNPTVGKLTENATLVTNLSKAASEAGADVALSTEMVISGYPPRDLLLQSEFIQSCLESAESINSPIPLLIGTPLPGKERNLPGNGVISDRGERREV